MYICNAQIECEKNASTHALFTYLLSHGMKKRFTENNFEIILKTIL